MKRTCSAALILLLLGLLVTGVEAGELEVLEATLDNSLKVLLLEEHEAPIVTFRVLYRVGSREEQPGCTGLVL